MDVRGNYAVTWDDGIGTIVFGSVDNIESVTTTHDVSCTLTGSPGTVVVWVQAHGSSR